MGGAVSARFSFGDLLQEGPCSTGMESDPLEGWICRSTALGVCGVQASSLAGTGSLWHFGWGWAREMALASAFVPRQAELCRPGGQQLSLPLSSSPLILRAELLPFNLPDVKSRLLSEHTPSTPSAFASQTWGLCLAGRPPLCPGCQSVERAPPLRPSYPLLWASHLGLALENPFC